MANQNLNITISTLLREINLKERQALSEQLGLTTSVTVQQAMILRMIYSQPGLIQRDIVDVVHRRAATVSSQLKDFEMAGLIVRKIPKTNTRNKEIYLTDKGKQVVVAFARVTQVVNDKLTAALSDEQQETLVKLLTKVNGSL